MRRARSSVENWVAHWADSMVGAMAVPKAVVKVAQWDDCSVAHLAEQRDLSWAVGLAEKSVANSAVHSVAHWAA